MSFVRTSIQYIYAYMRIRVSGVHIDELYTPDALQWFRLETTAIKLKTNSGNDVSLTWINCTMLYNNNITEFIDVSLRLRARRTEYYCYNNIVISEKFNSVLHPPV